MKISVTEALRLKNEISKLVQNLQYKLHACVIGTNYEDDVEVSAKEYLFGDINSSLVKALKFSEEINDVLSGFNRDNKVDCIVRKLHNAKLLSDAYERLLPNTKEKKFSRWENLGDGQRKQVNIKYVPMVTSSEMKKLINEQKKIYRDAQKTVESLNMKEIEVSFSYDDLESIIVE